MPQSGVDSFVHTLQVQMEQFKWRRERCIKKELPYLDIKCRFGTTTGIIVGVLLSYEPNPSNPSKITDHNLLKFIN